MVGVAEVKSARTENLGKMEIKSDQMTLFTKKTGSRIHNILKMRIIYNLDRQDEKVGFLTPLQIFSNNHRGSS